jgi:hypothetical protein
MCRQGEVSLFCDAAAATGARRFGAQWLAQVLGERPDAQDCIDDAVLVASELVSNAVNAGCAYTLIALTVHRGLSESASRMTATDIRRCTIRLQAHPMAVGFRLSSASASTGVSHRPRPVSRCGRIWPSRLS